MQGVFRKINAEGLAGGFASRSEGLRHAKTDRFGKARFLQRNPSSGGKMIVPLAGVFATGLSVAGAILRCRQIYGHFRRLDTVGLRLPTSDWVAYLFTLNACNSLACS